MTTEATKASTLTSETETNTDSFNWDKVDPLTGFSDEKEKKSKVDEIVEEETEVKEDDENEEEVNNEDEEEKENEDETDEEETKVEKKEVKKEVKKDPKIKVEDKPTKQEDSKEVYSILAEELKEEGIFKYVDVPKKKTLTRQEFLELQEKEIEATFDNGIKDLFEGLDEKGKDYIKFIKDGGKTEDFMSVFVDGAIPDINIEDAATHKDVIEFYLDREGWTSDEIKDELESLEERKKIDTTAKRYYKKLKENESVAKAELLEKQEKKSKKDKKDREEFATDLAEQLKQTEIDGIPLLDKHKRTIPDFITKAVFTSNGKKITGFEKKLDKILKTPKDLLKLAILIDSDFNFDFIKEKAKTTVAKGVRRSLENVKNGGKDVRTTGSGSKKTLADFF